MKVGYIQRSILSMTEEEQKEMLMSRVKPDIVIPEMNRRRSMLLVMPEEIEAGSKVYVATLSALGNSIYMIYKTICLFKEKGIEVVALKEEFSSENQNEYFERLKEFGRLEADGNFSKEQIQKRPHKGGRKKIVLTPEQKKVLYEYECKLITQKEAVNRIKISNTAFYRLIRENKMGKPCKEEREKLAAVFELCRRGKENSNHGKNVLYRQGSEFVD